MNMEAIALLRDAVLTGDGHPEVGFRISCWVAPMPSEGFANPRGCSTAACFGGWCTIISRPELWEPKHRRFIGEQKFFEITATFLGISEFEAKMLCVPWEYWNMKEEDLTPDLAVKVLDHLTSTGRVDYEAALGSEIARRIIYER